MLPSAHLLALAAAAAPASAAAHLGFNYGAFFNNAAKTQDHFQKHFTAAKKLAGTNGAFTSARLFTMVQHGTTDKLIEAIPAAVETETSLLLSVWASGTEQSFQSQLKALQDATSQYCDDKRFVVVGISVGSEDLYRTTPLNKQNAKKQGETALPGVDAETLISYIGRVRKTIEGTCLEKTPVGHVDTWTAWVDGANRAVIKAVDFIGMDAYPYFEDHHTSNAVEVAGDLFQSAYDKVRAVAGDKEIFITEAGWPVSGRDSAQAKASPENAKKFWDQVGCPRFGKYNMWWFALHENIPPVAAGQPVFDIVGSDLGTPLFDLSCSNTGAAASSSSKAGDGASASKTAVASATASGSKSEPTGTPRGSGAAGADSSSGSGSGQGSGSNSGSGTGSSSGSGSGSGSSSGSGKSSTSGQGSSGQVPDSRQGASSDQGSNSVSSSTSGGAVTARPVADSNSTSTSGSRPGSGGQATPPPSLRPAAASWILSALLSLPLSLPLPSCKGAASYNYSPGKAVDRHGASRILGAS